jgi:hypothetical protein
MFCCIASLSKNKPVIAHLVSGKVILLGGLQPAIYMNNFDECLLL